MNLNFKKKHMDIGTFPFNFIRTLSLAGTGGAEINECFLAGKKIQNNSWKSWIHEWALLAEKVAKKAESALSMDQKETARKAYLRASNYYRSAMFPMSPSDNMFDKYLTLSREYFHKAIKLFDISIEPVEINMEKYKLPAYFISAGKQNSPTLVAINGGDSTNEELVQWIGLASAERGFNCIVFEGPGQWSALQLNPGFYMRYDYEIPTKAVIDYLETKKEVDPNKIAVIGYSLSTQLAIRASVFDNRIKACICSGGVVVDVYEAWHDVWPLFIQKAPDVVFDFMFEKIFEKISPQVHSLVNRFRAMFGLNKTTEIIQAWKPFNIVDLAPDMKCPLLLLIGEAEYAQTGENLIRSSYKFLKKLTCPVSIHEFTYDEGWAASHCAVGALAPSQGVIFEWLDKVINNVDLPKEPFDFKLINKYFYNKEFIEIQRNNNITKA